MDNNTSNVTDPSQGDQSSNPQAQGANSTSQGDQSTPSIEELQRKIAELERDNRKYRTERRQQDEAAQSAEQQRLKEQGEYKTLAEKHEARVKELEPLAQSYTQLATLVSGQIEAQIKDWPEEVKAFDPGPDSVEQRLAWIEKSRPLVAKLTQQQAKPAPGNSPNPKPAGGNQQQADVDELRQRYRSTGKYSF